jgi:hypothetical protein
MMTTIIRRTVNRTRGHRMAFSCKVSPLLHGLQSLDRLNPFPPNVPMIRCPNQP